MKGFHRAAGRRWHLLGEGWDPVCLHRTSARRQGAKPAGKAAGAPGTEATTWSAEHRRRGRTQFSSVSCYLPWETICPSQQVTGATERSSEPARRCSPSLFSLQEMETGWRWGRREGGRGREDSGMEGQRETPGRLTAAASAGGRPSESRWHKSQARSQETTTLNLNWLPFKYHLRAGFPASLSS